MKKEKIESFKLIKTLCAIGIIIFHFSCHYTNSNFRPLLMFENGSWGQVIVSIFFMISGALLYYNYDNSFQIKEFYKKRWLSIFPTFYLAYILIEILNMVIRKNIFFRGNFFPYIFTILGIDGYLIENVPTYYILGEWFLGMIIFLYLLFPIIRYLFKKNHKLTFILILILYLIFLDTPIINPVPQRSITASLFSFTIGMVIIKYKPKLLNLYSLLISFIISSIILFIKIPILPDLSMLILSLSLLIFMINIGEKIMKIRVVNLVFTELSKVSYEIFLLQHIVIVKLIDIWYPTSSLHAFVLLFLIVLLTILLAKLLNFISNKFVKKISIFMEK